MPWRRLVTPGRSKNFSGKYSGCGAVLCGQPGYYADQLIIDRWHAYCMLEEWRGETGVGLR